MGFDLANQLRVKTICVSSVLEHLIDVALASFPYGILTRDMVQDVVGPFTWNLCDINEQSPLSQPTLEMHSLQHEQTTNFYCFNPLIYGSFLLM